MAGDNEDGLRLRQFTASRKWDFVSEEDRYLSRREEPRYNFALIGCGTMGLEHLRVTALEGQARVIGVHDPHGPSLAAAQRLHDSLSSNQPLIVYDSPEAAANDPAVDLVIIATPNHSHWQLVEPLLASGKPMLVEKPMATTLEDAFAMLQAAEAHPTLFQLGLQYRYKALYAEALDRLADKATIGNLKTLRIAEYRPPFLDKVGQWNKFNSGSGGTLVEKCCHYFDLMHRITGAPPERVFANGSQAVNFRDLARNGEQADMLDNADVLIDYARGVRGSFTLNMLTPDFREELVVTGDKGQLRGQEHADPNGDDQFRNTLDIVQGDAGRRLHIEPSYPRWIEQSGHGGASWHLHRRLIDALDGKPSDLATAREGFWAFLVGAAAQQSIATGAPVEIADMLDKAGIDAADVVFDTTA
ncbi:MAG: Gfo/Idh/MocA family oxidoreductase [Pseudomonadota bacterium]